MKMLFFSPEAAEVEEARRELVETGIPCEVRRSPVGEEGMGSPACEELWVQNDQDSHRALMWCVEQGVGFSKRPAKVLLADEAGDEIPFEWAA
jgi:hypothetical protein